MIKKGLLLFATLLVVFAAILVIRALLLRPNQLEVAPIEVMDVPDAAIPHLQRAIQFPTVSPEDSSNFDPQPFLDFHQFLAATFPLVDSLLKKVTLNQYTLLYEWPGSNPERKPVIFLAHQDVVPIDEPTRTEWREGPFSGNRKDEIIWGRGAMDDKASLLALLEVAELLLADGFQPAATLYFVFGHDEELGGETGAKAAAEYLMDAGVQADFVLDEGGYIVKGMVPGLEKELAVINTAEKGYINLELTVTTAGGHSSAPPEDNAIGMLAQAIVDLEDQPFPAKILQPHYEMVANIGAEFPFTSRIGLANAWLFPSLLGDRTTIAPTIMHSGVKANVMPTLASATVNFRILPGETSEDVIAHVTRAIDNDRIAIAPVGHVNEPSAVSDAGSAAFRVINTTIKEVFPEVLTTSGLLGGGTDSKHFATMVDNIYRFVPIRIDPDNRSGFHGINERITVANYREFIRFYHRLLVNLNKERDLAD